MKTQCITRTTQKVMFAGAGIFLGVSVAAAAAPKTIADTYGSVAIGDLPGMLDRVGELAQTVNPGFSGDVIRGQLGMLLGDAGLKSIPAGSGMIVVQPVKGKPFLLLETADGKAQNIADMLKQRLGVTTKAINGKIVAVATKEEAMKKATGEMGTAAAAMLANDDDKFIVATIDTDKLIQDNGDKYKALLKKLPQKAVEHGDADSSGTAKSLVFLGNMVLATAKRTDVATLKIDISKDGVLFEKTMYPIGGVHLDAPTGPTGQDLRKQVPATQNALGSYEYHLDTQSATKAISPIIMEALESSGASASDRAELQKMFDQSGQAYGDAFGGWIAPEENGPRGALIFAVADKDKAMQEIQMEATSFSTGAMHNMLGAIGVKTSATLTKNVGKVDGQPVHSYMLSMDSDNKMSASNPYAGKTIDMKFAFVNDKLLLATGDESIDDIAASVKNGATSGTSELQSRAKLPAGAFYYADYHLGALGKMMTKINPSVSGFFDKIKDSTLLEAAYTNDESVKFIIMIPGEMITKIASGAKQMAQKHQMDKMQNEENKQAEPDADNDMGTTTQDEVDVSTSTLDN